MALHIKPIILATASALALTACVGNTVTPNATGPQNRTRDGAVIGGLLGGFLGAASGSENQGRNAILGAAAGAAAGGVIGNVLDRQAQDLRGALSNDRILIENTGSELIVTMPEGILFDIDSASIRAGLQGDLRALAANLNQYPSTDVEVVGHTDNTGSAGYNQDLSTRRAQGVAGVLLEAGVAPARVRSFGRGESAPIATNLTPEGRQQNRRVEVIIRPR